MIGFSSLSNRGIFTSRLTLSRNSWLVVNNLIVESLRDPITFSFDTLTCLVEVSSIAIIASAKIYVESSFSAGVGAALKE